MRNSENLNYIDNSFTPFDIRSNNVSNNSFKNHYTSPPDPKSSYSPFVVKKSSNLHGSNSNSQNKPIFSENNTMMHKNYTPSPINIPNERLSDRFIPVKKGINLLEKFELAKIWENHQTDTKNKTADDPSPCDNNSNNYSTLLQNNFFGSNDSKSGTSPIVKSNLFKFKTETKKRHSNAYTMNNLYDNCNETNINYTRKINPRPYKVLDAPGLIDDFYLNLLDWSSNNDIAVGLSNSVYIWCANKTQVVKLMSYENEKSVSSVIWNGR